MHILLRHMFSWSLRKAASDANDSEIKSFGAGAMRLWSYDGMYHRRHARAVWQANDRTLVLLEAWPGAASWNARGYVGY